MRLGVTRLSATGGRRRGTSAPMPDPLLTAASATVNNETSANASVSANRNNGVLYWVATTAVTQPTPTQIKAGQNASGTSAPASGSQAISASGVQSIFGGVLGLTAGTTYYLHFYMETSALVASNVSTSNSFVPADVTAPVLSSAEGVQTGATTANLTVNTDTAEGTLYWVATTSATTPSQAQIIAGQDHTGAAAVNGSRSVTASGPQAFGITGLTGSTTYWAHFAHRDTALNISTPATVSASFTTPSITYYFQAFNDGSTALAGSPANCLFTANYTDSAGGSNAILWRGDGLGPASPATEAVQFGTANTFANAITRIRCKFKVVSSVNAKMWLRIRALNVTSTDLVHIDISNDSTPDSSRVGSAPWANTTVTSLGSGWFQFQGDYDAVGDADRVGNLFFYMGTSSGALAVINDVVGSNQVAIYDLTFEQL